MVELRVNAGNVKNPNVHKIGIIALGSHLENHGPALPIDTDAKIASYIAFQAALESGAKFLGVIYPAHEIKEINHGIHVSLDDLTNEIINVLKSAKKHLMRATTRLGEFRNTYGIWEKSPVHPGIAVTGVKKKKKRYIRH